MNGVTPAQEEYFRILATIDPSDDMRRHIDNARADLAYRARRDEYQKLAQDKPRRRLMRRFHAWLTR